LRSGFSFQLYDSSGINSRQNSFSDSAQIKTAAEIPAKKVMVPVIQDNTVEQAEPYTSDTLWNSGGNFLTTNPLVGFLRAPAHDILYGETIKSNDTLPLEREHKSEDWLTGLLFFVVFLLVWIRVFYGKYYSQLTDSLVNYQMSSKLYNEANILSRRVSFILDIVYHLVMAIFLYELNSVYGILAPGRSNLYYLMVIFAVLAFYSVSRLALLRFTGFVFDIQPLFTNFIHHMSLFNKGLGIILFPLSIAMLFIPASLIKIILFTGITVFIIMFVLKLVRALKIIMWKDVLLFYMILYLCTLEILPLLLGYKLMKSMILSY
jgi:hypothetical protein